MILSLSWRNIWRNKVRSLVVMGAIVIGVWSVVFLIGMMAGIIDNYVDTSIRNEVSHLQIHDPQFPDEKESRFYFEKPDSILKRIRQMDQVQAATSRSLANAMLSSSQGARGIQLRGVDPEQEPRVTRISEQLVEGEYLDTDRRNPVLISRRLAEKLDVKLRSKVVLTFQDLENNITAGAFRVSGIFDTENNMYDESVAFVRQDDLNRLLGKDNIAHEVAILIHDVDQLDTVKQQLQVAFPDLLVRTYREISPELELFETQLESMAYIYIVIFMLALIFGIINTMLMAVLERVRELGMLMAIGMNKLKVFSMIVLETLMLAMVSAPVGLLISLLTTTYFKHNGLNLFFFASEGMEQFGISNIVYPSVSGGMYLQVALAVALTALLASLYPAWKAIRLRPVEAIRKL